jgi:hypothetical protein
MKTASRFRVVQKAAALAAVAGMTIAAGGTALAQTEGDPSAIGGRRGTPAAERVVTIDRLKARCIEAIDKRLPALARAKQHLADSAWVTDGHRSALNGQLDAQTEGLKALKEKIAGDSDRETLIADCRSIVHDYRVFALMLPKTRLVIGADRVPGAAARLTQVAVKLQGRIDEAEAAGKDVTAAQEALDKMTTEVGSATDAADGVADAVLPLKPQDYPDNKPVLDGARTSLGQAHGHLKAAAAAGRQVVAALKALG